MLNRSKHQPRRIFVNGRATFHHHQSPGYVLLCRILPSRGDSRASDTATAGNRIIRSNRPGPEKVQDLPTRSNVNSESWSHRLFLVLLLRNGRATEITISRAHGDPFQPFGLSTPPSPVPAQTGLSLTGTGSGPHDFCHKLFSAPRTRQSSRFKPRATAAGASVITPPNASHSVQMDPVHDRRHI